MFLIKNRKIFFLLSAILVAASLFGVFYLGLNYSIDFRGGTLSEVRYTGGAPELEEMHQAISSLGLGGYSLRASGEEGFVIRTRELSVEEKGALIQALDLGEETPTIERQNTIGPLAGAELRNKALVAVFVAIIMIMLFITFAFRKVSRPVSSWKYGLATVVALGHDIIIPTGIFAFLGYFFGTEVDLLFVTGLLAILGYSVHDTIVVFDRVRENLRINQDRGQNEEFESTVGRSVTQTIGRSVNTSITILITLLALYFFGPSTIQDFSLLLIVGLIVGTYSSIFAASPLLVTFQKLARKK